jgi:hypothetical protein
MFEVVVPPEDVAGVQNPPEDATHEVGIPPEDGA